VYIETYYIVYLIERINQTRNKVQRQ
jgi:hypothetical protein